MPTAETSSVLRKPDDQGPAIARTRCCNGISDWMMSKPADFVRKSKPDEMLRLGADWRWCCGRSRRQRCRRPAPVMTCTRANAIFGSFQNDTFVACDTSRRRGHVTITLACERLGVPAPISAGSPVLFLSQNRGPGAWPSSFDSSISGSAARIAGRPCSTAHSCRARS